MATCLLDNDGKVRYAYGAFFSPKEAAMTVTKYEKIGVMTRLTLKLDRETDRTTASRMKQDGIVAHEDVSEGTVSIWIPPRDQR
ncbi:MAG: hypothetical protein A3B30_01425 [Candidatus Komeilibacteria bacterium RIFCSPLOWO2_01_FULL_52_15]|uniref:Uncharacterized protein n=2 Tax=Candidatus Komeiliibacteriota TaxID=1817908 RepID=A0A1G2BP86_9BACT|nr:MAG: hypothetical protein A2677_02970 [Candidatus Komeilibacteria bacterium RIFCSPHIGHO2_01_FULL_52_14]OGY90586.1 MAG: hypothetical protein A3B30_01425 [Candidatus Komeilibacteria bacterium RIFCSPLOWO2_01_FULL_52_15]